MDSTVATTATDSKRCGPDNKKGARNNERTTDYLCRSINGIHTDSAVPANAVLRTTGAGKPAPILKHQLDRHASITNARKGKVGLFSAGCGCSHS